MTDDGSDKDPVPAAAPAPAKPARTRAQYIVAITIVAFAVVMVMRQVLQQTGIAQTSAFYIAIPAVVALLVVFSAPGKSAIGVVVKVVTVLLLLSMMLVGEGFICVIIVAPVFYLVAVLVTVVVEAIVKGVDGRRGGLPVLVVPALVLLASMEGVVPAMTLAGATTVEASRTIEATPEQVEAAWQLPMDFDANARPGVLSWGFPEPLDDSGGALEVGQRRIVTFSGAHHRSFFVSDHHWGEDTTELIFEVVARTPNSARLKVVADTTPISTWLTWNVVDINWYSVDPSHTAVDLDLSYTRELAPAWYFGPIEEFVSGRAASYLLDTLEIQA